MSCHITIVQQNEQIDFCITAISSPSTGTEFLKVAIPQQTIIILSLYNTTYTNAHCH